MVYIKCKDVSAEHVSLLAFVLSPSALAFSVTPATSITELNKLHI